MDDQEEFLPCTDDESFSETEDQCLPVPDFDDKARNSSPYFVHTKLEFIITKLLLILSSTALIILLPLYMETVNVQGNVYALIITSVIVTVLVLLFILLTIKLFNPKYRDFKFLQLPLPFFKLSTISSMYMISAFAVIYGIDRKRVLCHIQDPMKGIIVDFSLLYYFFFCDKLMGLQRIFSTTTIIVGLFIAVDYGLCDEFKCRGYERMHASEDTGPWTWQTHLIWSLVYVVGLAIFSGFFTVLQRFLSQKEVNAHPVGLSTSLLSTVSRSLSNPSINSNISLPRSLARDEFHLFKKNFALHLSMWIHIFGLVIAIALFWIDYIPEVGKGAGVADSVNYTMNGILCHCQLPSKGANCGNLISFSWPFMLAYVIFAVASIKFLILTQCAVYTVATMTVALPLSGIWWSLFRMAPLESGLLVWAPSVNGELICSLLGLPIVSIGEYLLYKSHLKDYQWSRLATTHVIPASHLA